MKIGVFGGTFDPIHVAHLMLAETARDELKIDEIWFIPAYSPPQKQGSLISSPKDRLEMVRLGIAGHTNFRVSKLEIDRKGTSFTVDTLRTIKEAHPNDELFLIVGGDSLRDFLTWKDPSEILDLAELVAVNRGREPLSAEHVFAELGEKYRNRIRLLSMTPVDISASEIRERFREKRSFRYLAPRSVELYVETHQLYRPKETPQ